MVACVAQANPPPPSQPNNLRYSGDGLCECYVEERLVMAWLHAIIGGGLVEYSVRWYVVDFVAFFHIPSAGWFWQSTRNYSALALQL